MGGAKRTFRVKVQRIESMLRIASAAAFPAKPIL
jgi:hypothetical protein